jgi:3-hydroxybutyryl-CoA dehydrogenase
MNNLKSAAVIGSGMMGPGIAVTLSLGGVETTIVSRTPERAQAAANQAMKLACELAECGLMPTGAASVSAECDLDRVVRDVDLVIESVPEDLALKQDLFRRLDGAARADAVLASNTSSLRITEIAAKCSRPERIVTTHFWNPPHLMRLVEIVKGDRTSAEVVARVKELLTRCGKLPVVVKKDTPGQLGNRLQFALLREAIHIVEQGIADVEDVDTVVKNGFGLRMPVYGVFEHQDVVGLRTCKAVMDYVAPSLGEQKSSIGLLNEHLSKGCGFYPTGQLDHEASRARRDAFVRRMLVEVLRDPKSTS